MPRHSSSDSCPGSPWGSPANCPPVAPDSTVAQETDSGRCCWHCNFLLHRNHTHHLRSLRSALRKDMDRLSCRRCHRKKKDSWVSKSSWLCSVYVAVENGASSTGRDKVAKRILPRTPQNEVTCSWHRNLVTFPRLPVSPPIHRRFPQWKIDISSRVRSHSTLTTCARVASGAAMTLPNYMDKGAIFYSASGSKVPVEDWFRDQTPRKAAHFHPRGFTFQIRHILLFSSMGFFS